jgi:hypothetical protein
VYDTATGNVVVTLDEAAAAAAAAAAASVGIGSSSAAGAANAAGSGTGSGEMMRGAASACFSPSGGDRMEERGLHMGDYTHSCTAAAALGLRQDEAQTAVLL